MTPVFIDQGRIAWLEPENEEERDFIRSCPVEWTWEEVKEAFERGD